jgi:enoyl-CoA hydratase/carnithine racemase
MNDLNLDAVRVEQRDGVAHLTIDHPPVNLMDEALIHDLQTVVATLQDAEDVRVLVTQSADPDFFAAHVDFGFMFEPERFMGLARPGQPADLNPMQAFHLAVRNLPQITIAKLRGRLRGGGSELAMAHDLRFAAAGETWFSQVESRVGIFPGGGGTQLLTPLVGRARALEIILGGALFDSEVAERYGWINRALPAADLDGFVDDLAARIAALPAGVAAAARQAVDAGTSTHDLSAGLVAEGAELAKAYPAPDSVVERLRAAVEGGAQGRESELELERALDRAE